MTKTCKVLAGSFLSVNEGSMWWSIFVTEVFVVGEDRFSVGKEGEVFSG